MLRVFTGTSEAHMQQWSFFQRLKGSLERTRQGLGQKLEDLLQRDRWDENDFAAMEEVLLGADVGVKATERLLQAARENARRVGTPNSQRLADCLRQEMIRILTASAGAPGGLVRYSVRPWVVMFVGVNGVGKTTTIGKLAAQQRQTGKKVLLVAGDTFRAAAIEQLEIWGQRVGADVIKHQAGQDPSGVAFDALRAAKKRDADIVLIDTAGRLHTKVHLLAELRKMRNIINKEQAGAPHETLLVLDAATGQNAVQQARVFKESLDITGIVLAKLDGTAKGGVVLGIQEELGLPVQYIGAGEDVEDLYPFNPESFVQALFGN
jgi:fused signal recognition particle receptor